MGVITSTSFLSRSSQVLTFFGLPLRVTNTTTELVTKPLVGVWVQVLATSPVSTSLSMSGASERVTTSVGSPPCTARVCSPEEP